MPSIHYCAAWTECGYLLTCGHSHTSVGEAANCVRSAGAYVVAVDVGTIRCLNHAEEAEFQIAVHRSPVIHRVTDLPAISACTAIDSRYAVMTRIKVGGQWTWTTWMCFRPGAEAAAHAREGDKVVRFLSAEWQELRQQTRVAPAKHVPGNIDLPRKSLDETLFEFVFRLLSSVGDLHLGSNPQPATITSEGGQDDEIPKRKRA